ncbi:MAG: sigma-70 family RNA polymerase sigma factor [Pirellulaceae bacterium]
MSTAIANERVSPAELVQRHQADVWRYLRLLGCDDSLADDLTQETFLEVLRRKFEYRGRSAAGAYLRKVARNRLLMAVRKTRRGPTLEQIEAADAVWAETFGDDGNEYLAALDDCLGQLDGRPAEVVELQYRQGLSREEIAERLTMKPEGVKTLLRRTREVLRRCIEGRVGE